MYFDVHIFCNGKEEEKRLLEANTMYVVVLLHVYYNIIVAAITTFQIVSISLFLFR